jgi:hypothetical protein
MTTVDAQTKFNEARLESRLLSDPATDNVTDDPYAQVNAGDKHLAE